MVRSDRWKRRKCVVRYFNFKDELQAHWGDRPFPNRVSVCFYLPMPKSWSSKKKQKMGGRFHTQRPDLDNLIKSIFDCLLEEDAHICQVAASKYWADSGAIAIAPLD